MIPTLVMIALGAFVTTLDNTIVAAGAPSIARDLGLDLPTLQWVSIGYMLPFAGLLPVAGTLVDRWGQAATLRAGLLAFGAGAAVGGVAMTAWLVIAARVLQGAAAAFLVPTLLSLLRTNLDARGRAVGATVWTACLAVALALGPPLGGVLSEYLGWGWIFFVNLPFVAAMLALRRKVATAGRDPAARRPAAGSMLVMTTGMVLITAAVVRLGEGDVLAPVALGAAGTAFASWFVLREKRARERLVPPELTRQRVFTGALGVQMLWGLGVSGIFFFTPLLHQEFLGLGPVLAGLPLVVVAVAVVAATPLVPWAVPRFGPHRTVATGLATVAAGLLALAAVNHVPEVLPRIPSLVLIGAGSALTTPLTSYALEIVAERHSGTASGLLTASRELSSALGVALIGTVLAVVRTARLGEGAAPALAGGYTAGLLTAAALELVGAVLAFKLLKERAGRNPSPSDKRGDPFLTSP
ncbi:MFS transporter [Amycolatopsis regifaucium]|uniref:MFS transporter n=1 Tax=Amycolatopsis regifaucium TaxID=546365 RepID=A0A154M3F1_9PSEU|nr:MFS transporter [Amycolatopsis regifaucium]KZB79141.1 MFS transporter [Amycolatopsis regifaucium]OKA07326.1 MFS transporter [Amycolatopsis regifaucium]SFH14304.1 Predicted arabinose efflux permease, MFS family [Amycolatopsis regifaucium]